MVRESTVITLKNYPKRYNVLYGKKELNKDIGAITIAKRSLNIPHGLNKYAPRSVNAVAEINDFLKQNNSKKIADFQIVETSSVIPLKTTSNAKILKIRGNDTEYKLYRFKDSYHLWIPDSINPIEYKHLHIKAKDDDIFKEKLESLFNNPTTRAKLDYKVYNIPFGLSNLGIGVMGLPKHEIFLDEEKITGAYKENMYNAIGIDGDLEQFDSKLGSVDRKQINYYGPLTQFRSYSDKNDSQLQIKDDVWMKSHEAAQFINGSHECTELLENIISQTYSGQNIDPKHATQMTTNMKEDFIHNLYGYGTLNTRSKGQTILPYGMPPQQWQGLNDPLKGGRIWESHAPSNQEIVLMMYVPQIDGTAKLRYDDDKKAFFSIIDTLKIEPKDRQYTMQYARKALGIKIAMKYLQEELAKIKLDDPVTSAEEQKYLFQKWQDLSYVKDTLFNNSGDLKDSLRKGNIGYSAYAQAIGLENVPNIKDNNYYITQGLPDKLGFAQTATEGLGEIAENYPYFENFWGWQGREYFGRSLRNIFKNQLFDKNIPNIVADNAVVMLTETLDRTGRRLKLFSDVYDRDADLGSLVKKLGERLNRGDYTTANDILKQQKERFSEFFQGKQDYTDTAVKRLALQGEGVLFEEEVFPTYKGGYLGDNNGIIDGINMSQNNILTDSGGVIHRLYWKEADKMALKLLPTMIDMARFMKAHQKRLHYQFLESATKKNREKILKDVYKCPEMKELDIYIKDAAHKMALAYFEKNKTSFKNGSDEDLRILFKHIRMEYMNVLQMTANVVAMVSYTPEVSTAKK